ncbi:MAG: ATP-dependent Clp protease adaptor ClpS [Desulfuromonadales bacterium]|jgi:ATP-dependent Clp protease adaptor protein ClpS|nr:ATP-dependent Clp protease adaptor ClpS [Desulfuromonadales bacterium]
MGQDKSGTRTSSEQKTRSTTPPLFKVVLLNDNYTPMEFVTEILEKIFRKPPPEANQIMLHVHYRGAGICGTYPFAIAESKVELVHKLARAEGHPLKAVLEEA